MEETKRWRLQKCCCCLPLRTGAICLAYLNLFLEALSLTMLFLPISPATVAITVLDVTLVENTPVPEEIALLFPVLSLVYAVVLVYALRKNDASMLHVYMWYGTTYIAVIVFVCLVFWRVEVVFVKLFFQTAIDVLFQGYILLIVHSVRVEILEKSTHKNKDLLYGQHQALDNATDVESHQMATASLEPTNNMAYADKTSL